jgi:hypothetical protein
MPDKLLRLHETAMLCVEGRRKPHVSKIASIFFPAFAVALTGFALTVAGVL